MDKKCKKYLELDPKDFRDFNYKINFPNTELPQPEKMRCKECKKIIGVKHSKEEWYPGIGAIPKNILYCPTCWQVKELIE